MNRNKDKKDIDPEELMRRKFHAKCLFRALGRLVMANAYWLIEGIDEYEGEDVKKRVEQALRGKSKKKQLLTVTDKGLLNKPLADRTDHEKRYIYRIIGGLKCFKRYPNHVKRKLAAVTYFQYYGPNRVIVREHQEAQAMYFIVSGEVTVSITVYDELVGEHVSQIIGQMEPGEMFGEISLLHNVPRSATVTTDGHCEFLQLMKEDFKNVLQASLQAQWDEMLLAMSAFTYFDGLDEVSRREGCILARTKTFDRDETILGDGEGVANHVYFVLTGQCQMIESLRIFVTKRASQEFYTLHDPWEPEEESEEDLEKKYDYLYKQSRDSTANLNEQRSSAKRAFISSLGSILKLPSIHGIDPRMSINKSKSQSKKFSTINFDESRPNLGEGPAPEECSNINTQPKENTTQDEQPTIEKAAYDNEGKRVSYSEAAPPSKSESEPQRPKTSGQILFSEEGAVLLQPNQESEKKHSIRYNVRRDPRELRTYFMQVCRFNPGSTFSLGENMRDRRIVAVTPVTCMLLPHIWLLQRNTANIWTRITHFLNKKIPKKEELFKEWTMQRQWLKYRDMVVDDVLANTHAINYTSVHDVPYSLRMNETLDI